jgi:hypothetical protein
MDSTGWFIATTHGLLGHDTTAAILGQPPGDRTRCVLCTYERQPTIAHRAAVITALTPAGA